MRTKFLVAIIAIAGLISIASCHWFSSSHHADSAINIEGKWSIDSMSAGKDSSSATGALLLALATKDSIKPVIEFNADSTYNDFPKTDSLQKKYYIKEKELFLQEDSAYVPYQVNMVSDSLIRLTGNDSVFIALKRQ